MGYIEYIDEIYATDEKIFEIQGFKACQILKTGGSESRKANSICNLLSHESKVE